MRRMWTRHELLRYAGAPVVGENTMRRMWTEQDLIELRIRTKFGDAIWNQVKDDIGISTMKRIYSEEMMHKHLQGFNLAMPDLTDKEYLGDGVYLLSSQNNTTLKYNVINGYFELNGTPNAGSFGAFIHYEFRGFDLNEKYSISYEFVSGFSEDVWLLSEPFATKSDFPLEDISLTTVVLYTRDHFVNDKFTFKLQIEKGDKATPLVSYNMRSYNQMDALGLIHHPSEEEIQLMNEMHQEEIQITKKEKEL